MGRIRSMKGFPEAHKPLYLLIPYYLMCLDAYCILDLCITGNFLQSLIPRPCLCCLHQTGSQSVTTALLIHVSPFDVGNRGCRAPFRVVAETDLYKSAESSPNAFHHEGDATLRGSKVGSNIVGILFCCASPQVEPHTEPLCMVCRLD